MENKEIHKLKYIEDLARDARQRKVNKNLKQIFQYEEGTLTPTKFVNSTANSVAGNLALAGKNSGYNITYISQGTGFEMALLDALLQLEEGNESSFLVGNVDEISPENTEIENKRGSFKKEVTNSNNLLQSKTKGTVVGEGSAMFVVSNNPTNMLAKVLDVGMVQSTNTLEVQATILNFLKKNNLKAQDIDTLIFGFNGDGNGDLFYHQLLDNDFNTQTVLSFKNLVGDYPTVSGFALWVASQKGEIPNESVYKIGKKHRKNILIYNHYQNEQHGFILVENENLIFSS